MKSNAETVIQERKRIELPKNAYINNLKQSDRE